jgi:hypothetical protein
MARLLTQQYLFRLIRTPFDMAFRSLLTLILAAFSAVEATQIMHRPANYKDAPHRFSVESNRKTHRIQRRATSKASFAYFTNWGIYGANFRMFTFSLLYQYQILNSYISGYGVLRHSRFVELSLSRKKGEKTKIIDRDKNRSETSTA